ELGSPPHERTVQRSVVRPVLRGPAGCHHAVETQGGRERRYQRRRAGGRHHQATARGALFLEQLGRVRLQRFQQVGGGGVGRLGHRVDRPTFVRASEQARRLHRQEVLARQLVHPVEGR